MKRDPRFPDRPEHPDFDRMSRAALEVDGRADEGENPFDIVGLDVTSMAYFLRNRLGILSQRVARETGRTFNPNDPLIAALYMDGIAVGQRLS